MGADKPKNLNRIAKITYVLWGRRSLVLIIITLNFNNKGLPGGGYVFFLKKYSDSQCCWKKYSDFGWGEKIIWFRVFVIWPNVKFWKKKFALGATKRINVLTLVLSEKKFLNETKNHNPPPFKLNGRSLISLVSSNSFCSVRTIYIWLFCRLVKCVALINSKIKKQHDRFDH